MPQLFSHSVALGRTFMPFAMGLGAINPMAFWLSPTLRFLPHKRWQGE